MGETTLRELIQKEVKEFHEHDDRDKMPDLPVTKPLGAYCDHTVLRAYTKEEAVKEFCKEAKEYGAASVCVMPYYVRTVHEELLGSGVHTGMVVGFPLGTHMPEVKALEAVKGIEDGAEEVDMVINVGALRDEKYDWVYEDIRGVVDAVRAKDQNVLVKVIIETCYLTDDEKIAACVIAREAGADYVKTSTGFGTDGAYADDVRLMRKVVGDTMKIKASTNIVSREDVLEMVKAGADRVGVSRIKQIVTGDTEAPSASTRNRPPEYRKKQ